MNRKILPSLLNKRREAIAGIIKARGNGGNANDILYGDTRIVSNRLFKSNPSRILTVNKKKWWIETLLTRKLKNIEHDIWEEYEES